MCNNLSLYRNSYILRYPGIPKSCPQCMIDLLHHKSYHLVFHASCKFCKFYQYKTFPKTADRLRARENKEKTWYKAVCPYCDKKFVESYQRKKHIEMEHMNQKLRCDECEKTFQCKQSLNYTDWRESRSRLGLETKSTETLGLVPVSLKILEVVSSRSRLG